MWYDMTPNVPLLRKVLAWVESQAELPWDEQEWDQEAWRTTGLESVGHQCGTTYCVAGYACEVSGVEWTQWNQYVFADGSEPQSWTDVGRDGRRMLKVDRKAMLLLGLTQREASQMFFPSNDAPWIRELCEKVAARAGETL